MANPDTPSIASFPVPPPAFNFPFVQPNGMLTVMGMQFLQILWASIQGAGGIIDIVIVDQPGGAQVGPGGAESIAVQAAEDSLKLSFIPRTESPDHTFGVLFSKSDISTAIPSAIIGRVPVPINWTIPALMNASYGKVQTAPSADTAFDLQVDGVSIGTATWLAGQTVPSFTKATASNLRGQHDWLDLVAPANLNGMAGAFGLSVMGTRSW